MNNRKQTVKEIDYDKWVRAEWMRKYLQEKGQPVPDELRQFTEHFRQQKADEDARSGCCMGW